MQAIVGTTHWKANHTQFRSSDHYIMECELSIIVPVYNSEKYLRGTVERLLTQIISDYEILLVDDGSTDDSSKICDELSDRNTKISAFHIPNSGPAGARNFGIRKAKGEYLAFCDSDDMPAENMYGILLSDLKENKVDYVLCDIYSERDGKRFGFPWDEDIKLEGRDIIDELLANMLGNRSDNDAVQPIWGSSVRCIYDGNIIRKYNIEFPQDLHFAEDLVFNVRYIKKIKSCFIRNEALYHYTCNESSLMNGYSHYNKNAFIERKQLVKYIEAELSNITDNADLKKRFRTTQRCYYQEMVGNAARSVGEYGKSYALNEIKSIIRDPIVKEAYVDYDAKSPKKRLNYWLMKKGCSRILLEYFYHRTKDQAVE